MTLYAVHDRVDHAPVLVADRFSWFAALLPPVYALVHRAWVMLAAWMLVAVLIGLASTRIGMEAATWCQVLVGLYFGFEGPGFRHRALASRGFAHAADIVGTSEDTATLDYLRQK